jgi:hypothetical protein
MLANKVDELPLDAVLSEGWRTKGKSPGGLGSSTLVRTGKMENKASLWPNSTAALSIYHAIICSVLNWPSRGKKDPWLILANLRRFD